MTIAFSADLTRIPAPIDLAGNLTVSTTLAADVTDIHDFVGALAPSLTFAADLTVVAAGAYGPDESVYPATSAAEGNAPSLLTLGSQIGILSNGRITHIRYWKASGMQPSRNVSIWDDAGILLFNAVSTGVPGWNLHEISPPLAVSVGDIIRVSYGYSGSGADGNFGFTNSAVWADTANLDFISGCYQPGSADSFPGIIVTDSNYYADIVYQQQLDVVVDLAGGLAPSLAFGADLTVVSAGDGHLYWRFTLDATQPGFGGYTLAEVQFRTAIGVPLTPTGGTPSAADTYPGLTVGPPGIDPRGTYDAAKACDGNVTTMWSSNGPPAPVQWWAYTYATPQDIVEFAITARGDGFALYTQTPVKITPQWSDDGVTWTSWPQLISDNWTFEGQTQVFRNPAVSYVDLAGNLSPAVTFAASLTVDAGGAPWTPTLVPGLEIWLDAAQLALADGASISTWTNLGSGSSPTITAPALTFKAGVVNGHGAVRFSSSGGYLRGTTTITKNYTLTYVTRRWGPVVGRSFMGPNPPVNVFVGYHGVGRNSCYDNGWLTFGDPWEDAASIPSQFDLFSYDSSAVSGSHFFVYGSETASNPVIEGLSNTWGISGYEATSPTELMDCDVGEVLVYDHQLTVAERQSCEGYLAWKWGVEALLPVDHPYRDAPPGGGPAGGFVDLAGDIAVSTTFAADVADIHDLAGNLTVSVTFAADVVDLHDFVGDLTAAVTFTADLTVSAPSINYVDFAGSLTLSPVLVADLTVAIDTANYVDFAGNLGGVSHYDRLKYGLGHYSRIDAFAPVFSAVALDIVGTDEFAGNLAPVVTFTGALERLPGLAGDLAPVVTFAGDLSLVPYVDFAGELAPTVTFGGDFGLVVDLAGDIAPQIDLDGLLGLDLPLTAVDGSFGFTVVLEASELISHPLWEGSEPCPPPDWEATEPCPPPVWVASAPPAATWGPSEAPPSLWTPVGPCDPVEWEESTLCNG